MPVPQRVDPTALSIQKAFVHTQTVGHGQQAFMEHHLYKILKAFGFKTP